MKKFFFLLLTLLPVVVGAAPITEQQALLKARGFMQGKTFSMEKSRRMAPRQDSNNAALYVFNAQEGGYVIISGDDQTASVLGYNSTGRLDMAQLPEHIQSWLDSYVDQIAYLQKHPEAKAAPKKFGNVPAIPPLLGETQWNQGSPYNDLCPMDGNNRSVTGCVATAMAQVMYFHKWPLKTTTEIPGYTTSTYGINVSAIPAGTPIDWSNMLPKYVRKPGAETTEQRNAVAELMQMCGTSVKMDYSAGSSAASTATSCDAFKEYFDYDVTTNQIYRMRYRCEEWNRIIYDELAKNRPVLYCGERVEGSGHAFVIDGYDKDGFFHVNWGWGGSHDGYFLLDVLYSSDSSKTEATGDGYCVNQWAIIGIQKNLGAVIVPELTVSSVNAYPNSPNTKLTRNSSSDNFSLYHYFYVRNYTAVSSVMECATGLYDTSDNLIGVVTETKENTFEPDGGVSISQKATFGAGLANGVYKLKALYRQKGETAWKTDLQSDQYYILATISGNSLAAEAISPQTAVTNLQVDIQPMDEVKVDTKVPVCVTVTNQGDDFSKEVYFVFDDKAVGGCILELEKGQTKALHFTFTPEEVGQKTASLAIKTWSSSDQKYVYKPIYSTTINVPVPQEASLLIAVEAEDAVEDVVTADALKLKITLTNQGLDSYSEKIRINLLSVNGNILSDYLNQLENVQVPKEQTIIKHVTIDGIEDGRYWLTASYRKNRKWATSGDACIVTFKNAGTNPKESYAVYNEGTLTFYNDALRSSRQGTSYDLNRLSSKPSWNEKKESISKVIFDASFANARPCTTEYWFLGCRNLTEVVGMKNLNTSRVTSMRSMFEDCRSLSTVDLSHFDTENVEDMRNMFYYCEKLGTIDVNRFDTRNVVYMYCMFMFCKAIKDLDISGFRTDFVNTMNQIAANCSNLEHVTLGNGMVTTEETQCENLFRYSSNLKTLTFTGDIPSGINSKFFDGVGKADAPATLEVPQQYCDHYATKFVDGKFFGGYFTLSGNGPVVEDAIAFADPIVEKLCLYYWDTNKDGCLTKQEAAAVKSLGDVFCLNPQKTKSWQGSNGPKDGLLHANFTSFDELQYFTGLTSIDDETFYSQQSLERITLPEGVKTIGKYAFYYCVNLKAIELPSSVETIGQCAFLSCKSAGNLTMGSSVKTIGDAAFRDCVCLSSVVVPNGCTAIGSSAFLGCTKLDLLTLPASLKNVGTFMIAYTEKTINISLGSKDLWQQLQMTCDDDEIEEGIVEHSDFKLYYNGQELTEVEIPQTMTMVDNRYKNCQSVKSLTIPATVTDIAVCAFNGCRNLETVTSYLQNPFYIEDAAFEYEDPNTHNDVFTSATLYVPKGTKAKFQSQYGWKSFKSIVEMGDEPVEAEPYVAYNNSGTLTFYYDSQRSSRGRTFDLNEGETMPEYSNYFYDIVEVVTKVVFDPSFADARPTSTFAWFNGFGSLEEIEGLDYLNTSEVTNMGYMFQNCGLKSLDLRHFNTDKVTSMAHMFFWCQNLENIGISSLFSTKNVTDMNCMFSGCSSLTSLDLSNFDTQKVTNMAQLFGFCTALSGLDLSKFNTSKVTQMQSMFFNCSSLNSLILSNKFVSDEETNESFAFSGCNMLKTITFTGDIPVSINSKFFEGVGTADSPATLDVPEQYREHYKTKFDGNKFFGGYFTLSGEEPDRPQLEMDFSILNAIDGIVYDEKPLYKISCKNNGTTKFEGSFLVKFYKPSDTGGWIANEDYPWTSFSINMGNGLKPGKSTWCSASLSKPSIGQNKFEYGYITIDGTEFILGSVFFELRPNEHYVTIVQTADIMTYCDENDLDFTAVEGLKAYIVPGFNNDSREAIMMNVNDVPAKTGLLLVGAPQAYLVPKTQSSTIYVNMLKGLLKGENVPRTQNAYTNYVFREGSQGFGFYLADEGGSYVYAQEAYLQVPTRVMNSRDFIGLTFDDATAVIGMPTGDKPFSIYNLSGVLVKSAATSLDGLAKGIYVVGGHKVVVK